MNQFVLWAFAGIGMLVTGLMIIALVLEHIDKIHARRCDRLIRAAGEIISNKSNLRT